MVAKLKYSVGSLVADVEFLVAIVSLQRRCCDLLLSPLNLTLYYTQPMPSTHYPVNVHHYYLMQSLLVVLGFLVEALPKIFMSLPQHPPGRQLLKKIFLTFLPQLGTQRSCLLSFTTTKKENPFSHCRYKSKYKKTGVLEKYPSYRWKSTDILL